MKYRVRFGKLARQDARDYVNFIRKEMKSPAAALKWMDGLEASAKHLSQAPEKFNLIPEADSIDIPYPSYVYHSHRVIYEIREAEREVWVARIYHESRQPLPRDDLIE